MELLLKMFHCSFLLKEKNQKFKTAIKMPFLFLAQEKKQKNMRLKRIAKISFRSAKRK